MDCDVLPPLSNDEITILFIAVEGGAVAPIGRWEEPVLSLAGKGLLEAKDRFNYVATAAAKGVASAVEDQNIRDLIAINNKIAIARQEETESDLIALTDEDIAEEGDE